MGSEIVVRVLKRTDMLWNHFHPSVIVSKWSRRAVSWLKISWKKKVSSQWPAAAQRGKWYSHLMHVDANALLVFSPISSSCRFLDGVRKHHLSFATSFSRFTSGCFLRRDAMPFSTYFSRNSPNVNRPRMLTRILELYKTLFTFELALSQ